MLSGSLRREHVVCSHMTSHLTSNSIISRHPHGFLRRLSCETQLVTVIHDWARSLNQHGQVDVIFLDFTKAFDSPLRFSWEAPRLFKVAPCRSETKSCCERNIIRLVAGVIWYAPGHCARPYPFPVIYQ